MKKYISNKIFLSIIGIILLILIWEIISYFVDVNNLIFPFFFDTLKEVIRLLSKHYTYKCILNSLFKVLVGFILAFILALIFGMLAANFQQLSIIFKPFLTMLRAIPTACLVFLFLVLVSYQYTPILMVSLIAFPILYESIYQGIDNISKDILDASKLDSKNSVYLNLTLKLPLAMPYIISGIVSSFAMSFKVEIMSEIIAGSTASGLGSMIYYHAVNDPTNMIPIFSYSFIAIIIALLFSFVRYFTSKIIK